MKSGGRVLCDVVPLGGFAPRRHDLLTIFSDLDAWLRLADSRRSFCREAHAKYVASISTPDMAVSWETCRLLCALMSGLKPRRILDLGSGFSSFLVRSWMKAESPDATIVSVDDNPHWLDQTRNFLEANDVPSDNLFLWEDFVATRAEPFDLVFHDLGRMSLRASSLATVLGLRAPHGVVVLDDVHKRKYSRLAKTQVRQLGLSYISAEEQTRDAYGRMAAVVTTPRRPALPSRAMNGVARSDRRPRQTTFGWLSAFLTGKWSLPLVNSTVSD